MLSAQTGKIDPKAMFEGALFFLAPLATKLISLVIKRFDAVSGIPGLHPTTIVSLVLFFAWLAHVLGGSRVAWWICRGYGDSNRIHDAVAALYHEIVLWTLW